MHHLFNMGCCGSKVDVAREAPTMKEITANPPNFYSTYETAEQHFVLFAHEKMTIRRAKEVTHPLQPPSIQSELAHAGPRAHLRAADSLAVH